MKKIFVGTMYVDEGDFDKTVNAINEQKNVEVTHFIVKKLPEKQAHDTLYKKWNSVKSDFDLFVKIDADTVLSNDKILSQIFDFMYGDKNITGMQVPIHDYLTDSLIAGLNCFKPEVIFNTDSDKLYCDRVDTGHNVVIRGDLVPKYLIPAAKHCFYCTKTQAFHFGLHRALKGQSETFLKVQLANKKDECIMRKYAIEGFYSAKNFRDNSGFDYKDKRYQVAFENALKKLG